jgi:hypothetical protein
VLDQERQFYSENLGRWLTQHAGKFVLVKGEELIGAYDTYEDALAEGARRFGLQSFLVRRVGEMAQEVNIPALTLGLLHDPFKRSA